MNLGTTKTQSKSPPLQEKQQHAEALMIKWEPRKIYASLLGFHLLIWYFQGAGVSWWWKGIPYAVSAIFLVGGVVLLGRRMWRFNQIQRIIFIGAVAALILTIGANLLPGGVTTAIPIQGVVVQRSWWNTMDQVFTIILLAGFFLTSITITRYVPHGRVWLGYGIVGAITLYAVLRVGAEKFVGGEIWGAENFLGFSNKNAFGHLLNVGFIFSLVIVITKSRDFIDWREKFSALTFCAILGMCILANDSRGGWVSLAIAIAAVVFFMLFKKRKKKKKQGQLIPAIAAIVLATIAAGVAPEFLKRFETDELSDYRFRYVIWGETLRQLGEIGATGTGLQGFRYRYNSAPARMPESIITHAESSYLTVAYEQGVPITLLLMALLFLHVGMAIAQKNRSWRSSAIGIGLLALVLSHGMFETLMRFTALNIVLVLMLGMLHGQRAWKGGLKNLKGFAFLKPAYALALGFIFSWGIFLFSTHLQFRKAFLFTVEGIEENLAWQETQKYLDRTAGEFELNSQLTLAWRERAKQLGIAEQGLMQRIATIAREQLFRQPADPLAWQALGYAQAATNTLIDTQDPLASEQEVIFRLSNLTDTASRGEFLQRLFNPALIELRDVFERRQLPPNRSLPQSALLEPADTASIIAPATPPPEGISFPFLADENVRFIVAQSIRQNDLLKRLFSQKKSIKDDLIESESQPQINLLQTWSRETLSDAPNQLDNRIFSNKEKQAARSLANANAIYPGLMTFYRDALVTLSAHRPELLTTYYEMLDERQRDTLWAAWQRFLVYDPPMRSPRLLDWIARSGANSQLRLQAARMTGERDPQQQAQILRSIFEDVGAMLSTRLDAADALQIIIGPDFWENDIPADIENTFEVRAKRFIAAYNTRKSTTAAHAKAIPLPSAETPRKLISDTAEILIRMEKTEKALEIYRAAIEQTPAGQAARQRTNSVRQRITDAAMEPQAYLGRLSVLSRSDDAQPTEVLDYLNLSLALDLHLGARDYLNSQTPRGLTREQQDELTFYAARVAALDRNIEEELRHHRQLLSR